MPNDERNQVSYYALRIFVGVIGLLMPVLVRVGAWWFEGVRDLNVISAYYYTGMREVFVTALVLAGAMLATYRTPSSLDTLLGTLAGLSAIGIALFPMDPVFAAVITSRIPALVDNACMIQNTCYIPHGFLGYHGYFVGAFFALAFVIIVFRFTAFTPRPCPPAKRKRNLAYRLCGCAMGAAGLSMAWFSWQGLGRGVFWSEAAAVMSFAIAWLVKGQLFFPDPGRKLGTKRLSIAETLGGR